MISSIFASVAITAETNPGLPGAGMAIKTKIPVIIVPRAMVIETAQAGRVDLRIGTAKAVAVTMTPGAGAGGIIGLMT
jgi:hypothetical protein